MTTPRLGLRQNAGQFALLVASVALVGTMVGMERATLPLLARDVFGVASSVAALSFLVAFGVVKAAANFVAGAAADRLGRRRMLIAGWLVGLPVPLIIMFAPTWGWVVVANVLLGVNQGLTWSITVVMKIDLVGPKGRGLALGLNESAGYLAVAAAAGGAGYLAGAFGPRPWPYTLGLGAATLGLVLAVTAVRDTAGHVAVEAGETAEERTLGWVFRRTSLTEPALSAASQAGLVNNLNDGVAWGLLPLYLAARGLGVAEIGLVAAVYPAVWGLGQMVTGAASDRTGRKPLIWTGMVVQGVAILWIAAAGSLAAWVAAAAFLGLGTALVYPTLLAAISDVAAPRWRARAVGVYRLWRDLGFAVGGIGAGLAADRFGMVWALRAVGLLTIVSGLVVLVRMYETAPWRRPAGRAE